MHAPDCPARAAHGSYFDGVDDARTGIWLAIELCQDGRC